ncbi:MarR family transcriptional regulator [Isoptericola sp. CG 20/1183]|uniref:MarR family transcriptional regulator n=1 Tax=Isoptericola halotolerans TaxID=300560 RepID=A0ABX5EJM4_9MICO|nr:MULTISPECIES: MarR family transcriptional regulator [Isoptericola]PRZ08855.1 MarR family transcriptional regulator [Isoptericola halotolerans]PRZ10698.1 MarR family transcriptional regulator [Isoptericola sp. CG 20/1183]
MDAREPDLRMLDRALVGLRRFLTAPPVLDDQGRAVELSTLLVLNELPTEGQSVQQIATRLGVAHSTASRLVTRAEGAGMVTRTDSPDDARRRLVVPTAAGRGLRDRAAEFRLERLADIVDGWTPDEVHTLARSLHRFAQDQGAVHEHRGNDATPL